jgi:hypothetical protein
LRIRSIGAGHRGVHRAPILRALAQDNIVSVARSRRNAGHTPHQTTKKQPSAFAHYRRCRRHRIGAEKQRILKKCTDRVQQKTSSISLLVLRINVA